jgi:hypothetical protein
MDDLRVRVSRATRCPCSEGTEGGLIFGIFFHFSKALLRYAYWQQVASTTPNPMALLFKSKKNQTVLKPDFLNKRQWDSEPKE